jgi:hypothetical protein
MSEHTGTFSVQNETGGYITNVVGILIVGSTTCGFEASDNGLNVVIILYPTYFSVVMPRSSSCNNNSYNSRA